MAFCSRMWQGILSSRRAVPSSLFLVSTRIAAVGISTMWDTESPSQFHKALYQ